MASMAYCGTFICQSACSAFWKWQLNDAGWMKQPSWWSRGRLKWPRRQSRLPSVRSEAEEWSSSFGKGWLLRLSDWSQTWLSPKKFGVFSCYTAIVRVFDDKLSVFHGKSIFWRKLEIRAMAVFNVMTWWNYNYVWKCWTLQLTPRWRQWLRW